MSVQIARTGEAIGTYDANAVEALVQSGQILETDYFWTEGMAEWQPVASRWHSSGALAVAQDTAAFSGAAKVEPLSIWSLCLGVASWLCFSILAGLPAVICGHASLKRMRQNSLVTGKGMAVAGLVLGYASFLPVLVIAAVVLYYLIYGEWLLPI